MSQNNINGFIPDLLAPCGINCRVCYGYLREKNKCCGCRINGFKPAYCMKCIIINCNLLKNTSSGFCYDCITYPCKKLKQLDKRYRLRYNTSLISNLESIKTKGVEAFIESDKQIWTCKTCGGIICIHSAKCIKCNN